MKKEYDVIIVGGGPSGSMAAIEIAKEIRKYWPNNYLSAIWQG